MSDLTDDDLGAALADLGAALTLPDVDLASAVRAAAAEPGTVRRAPLAAVAAAVLVVALGAVVAIAPARSAVADWLGIGRTAVEVDDDSRSAPPPVLPTTPTGSVAPSPDEVRTEAAAALPFAPRLPAPELAGAIVAWEAGGDELVVVYDGFVVQGRPATGDFPLAVKTVQDPDTVSRPVSPDGLSTLWIGGAHVRDVGGVPEAAESALLWVADGVEWRIAGSIELPDALDLADSMT